MYDSVSMFMTVDVGEVWEVVALAAAAVAGDEWEESATSYRGVPLNSFVFFLYQVRVDLFGCWFLPFRETPTKPDHTSNVKNAPLTQAGGTLVLHTKAIYPLALLLALSRF
jgi:hypothetical protein